MKPLRDYICKGDRRSLDGVEDVVKIVLRHPARFNELIALMSDENAVVRMRSSDAVEKISARYPEWLQPYKDYLLSEVSKINQQEVRWHFAQILPRLTLTQDEQRQMSNLLLTFLNDQSNIVIVFSLQALADFASRDNTLREKLVPILQRYQQHKSAAVRKRAERLLNNLNRTH